MSVLLPDHRERAIGIGDDWERSQSGIYLPSRQRPERPIGVDLFAGAGGFSLGFEQAGWHVAAAAEGDYDAMCTYLTNLGTDESLIHFLPPFDEASKKAQKLCAEREGQSVTAGELGVRMEGVGYIRHHDEIVGCEHYYFGDIRALTGEHVLRDLGAADIGCVFGGPPCQGFSISGRRNVVDPRNSMVFEFARLVLEIMPATMVMENVPGILSMTTPEGIPVVDALCRIWEDGGFGNYDALRKSLLTSSGAGGAVRGKTQALEVPDEELEPEDQLALEIE